MSFIRKPSNRGTESILIDEIPILGSLGTPLHAYPVQTPAMQNVYPKWLIQSHFRRTAVYQSILKFSPPNRKHNNQTRNNQRPSNPRNKNNTPPTSREFASDHIMLTLKIPMKANEQYNNRNTDECRPERFSNVVEF